MATPIGTSCFAALVHRDCAQSPRIGARVILGTSRSHSMSHLRALLLTDVVDSTKLSLRRRRCRDGHAVGRA